MKDRKKRRQIERQIKGKKVDRQKEQKVDRQIDGKIDNFKAFALKVCQDC